MKQNIKLLFPIILFILCFSLLLNTSHKAKTDESTVAATMTLPKTSTTTTALATEPATTLPNTIQRYLICNENNILMYIAIDKNPPYLFYTYGYNNSKQPLMYVLSAETGNQYMLMSNFDYLKADETTFKNNVFTSSWREEDSLNVNGLDLHVKIWDNDTHEIFYSKDFHFDFN